MNGLTLQELVEKTKFDLGRIKTHKPAQVLSREGLAMTYIYIYGDREPMIGSTTLPLMGLRIYNLPFEQLLQMPVYFSQEQNAATEATGITELIEYIFELYENTPFTCPKMCSQVAKPLRQT